MKKISSDRILKLASYAVVGGLATIVEWIGYWIFSDLLGINYMAATVLAIVVSTFSNWVFGRLITFRKELRGRIISEIAQIYIASIVGLLLNLLLMGLFHEKLGINGMLSKMLATGVVFLYNYLARTRIIYKEH